MFDQIFVFSVLGLALVLFVHGGLRYDLVAVLTLLAVVLAGVAPADEAFAGFGHPAVVTVAAVLVISRGMANAGVVDVVARQLDRLGSGVPLQLAAMTLVVAVGSGFMNNVGALALMMPVAVSMARSRDLAPSLFLMPLAFGSLLGGLTTLIGTPPNLIISAFREDAMGQPFGMFDFAPVGAGVALAGLAFILIASRRLIPCRKAGRDDLYLIESYLTEFVVEEDSPLVGQPVGRVEEDADITLVGLERAGRLRGVPSLSDPAQPGDVLVLEGTPDDLAALVQSEGLTVRGSKDICTRRFDEDARSGPVPLTCEDDSAVPVKSSNMQLVEGVVARDSAMVARTVIDLDLRQRYGVNLLAVARQGESLRRSLKTVHFQPGDVLLLQGTDDMIRRALTRLGCLPLEMGRLRMPGNERALPAAVLFALGIAATALGLAPVQIALTAVALALVLMRVVRLRELYESIEWPVVVLLGAMFPLGLALESTGGAGRIAGWILSLAGDAGPAVALTMLMAGTMILSNVVNNAAAALLMAPVAVSLAQSLGGSPDPMLMAVCVGSSTPFLTPIGHQSNTLVMGPGGYRFSDYWKLGLPLSGICLAVAVPLILIVWPL